MSRLATNLTGIVVLALAMVATSMAGGESSERKSSLSGEDFLKLSQTRVLTYGLSIWVKCSSYQSALSQILGTDNEQLGLIVEGIDLIRHHDPPLRNPEPVLRELERCREALELTKKGMSLDEWNKLKDSAASRSDASSKDVADLLRELEEAKKKSAEDRAHLAQLDELLADAKRSSCEQEDHLRTILMKERESASKLREQLSARQSLIEAAEASAKQKADQLDTLRRSCDELEQRYNNQAREIESKLRGETRSLRREVEYVQAKNDEQTGDSSAEAVLMEVKLKELQVTLEEAQLREDAMRKEIESSRSELTKLREGERVIDNWTDAIKVFNEKFTGNGICFKINLLFQQQPRLKVKDIEAIARLDVDNIHNASYKMDRNSKLRAQQIYRSLLNVDLEIASWVNKCGGIRSCHQDDAFSSRCRVLNVTPGRLPFYEENSPSRLIQVW